MKIKMNYWKVLSIIFILLIIVLTIFLYTNSYYDFNGMKIKKSTMDDFSRAMNDKPFKLCDTIQNKCMVTGRLK